MCYQAAFVRLWHYGHYVWLLLSLLGSGMTACQSGAVVDNLELSASPLPESEALLSGYGGKLRLFWVNSYAPDDPWSREIQMGIWEELANVGISENNLIWGAFHLDVMRYANLCDDEPGVSPSVEDLLESDPIIAVADAAIAAIVEFQPDIVIVSDDEAALTVIPRYPDPNMRFVYCGVNGDPEVYNLVRPSVIGVVEEMRPLQTIEMARAFMPEAKTFLLLSDMSYTSQVSIEAIQRELQETSLQEDGMPVQADVLIRSTGQWEQWQEVVHTDGLKADCIVLIGYPVLENQDGERLTGEEVMAWMLLNTPVPVFALSDLAVIDGAIGGLVVSGYNQGAMAVERILRIIQGTHPSAVSPYVTGHNLLSMNLAAARFWNLQIPITFPIAARVYEDLPVWQGDR